MSYVLFICSLVVFNGDTNGHHQKHKQWSPVATFSAATDTKALKLCKDAARKLGVGQNNVKCIRNK